MKKTRVSFFSFTCCEGCIITFLEVLNKKYFQLKEKIEFENIRILKQGEKIQETDIAFIEGAISTKQELETLLEIRKKAKKIVALGSGAVTGYPSNLRNFLDEKKKKEIEFIIKKLNQLKEVSPITKFIDVDYKLEGCPIQEKTFIKFLDSIL